MQQHCRVFLVDRPILFDPGGDGLDVSVTGRARHDTHGDGLREQSGRADAPDTPPVPDVNAGAACGAGDGRIGWGGGDLGASAALERRVAARAQIAKIVTGCRDGRKSVKTAWTRSDAGRVSELAEIRWRRNLRVN